MSEAQQLHRGYVFLVEDDDALRSGMSDILASVGYQVQVWGDAAAFLGSLPPLAPAVLVTDMRLPGFSGVDLHAELVRRNIDIPVVYVSGESSVPETIRAMKQGAFDFLVKPFGREQFLAAISGAIERHRSQVEALARRERHEEEMSHLSPRERQVHDLLLRGFSNSEIMAELRISLPTAKQYKAEVMRKLDVRALSELLAKMRALAPH